MGTSAKPDVVDDADLGTDADAFNDEDLIDGIDAAIDDQLDVDGDDDPDKEEVPGVTDDDTLDDGEDAAAAGVDRGDGRDAAGRFASKEEQDAADKASADAKTAGKSPAEQAAAATKAAGEAKAAAGKPAADAAAAAAPKWEPLNINAGRAVFPIGEAKVTRSNGHVLIAVPEKDFNQFSRRIGRGIDAEQRHRDITAKQRQLDFKLSAPAPKSNAEIEAEIFMKALGDQINELFSPEQLQILKLQTAAAQRDEKDRYATAEKARETEAASGEEWSRSQVETLVDLAFELVEQHPDLKGMTPEQIKETLDDLAMPVRDRIVFKENGETVANTEVLFKLLKRGLLSSGPATAAPAAKPAAEPAKATTDATRFNKQQESAAAPRSTSLKDGRGTPTSATRRPTRATVPPSQQRTAAQRAEDEHRKTVRSVLASDSFDDD